MRKILILTILLCFIGFIGTVQAEGIEFFHGTWEEAMEEAKKQEKLLFVDAYAVWCGPCKRMAKNIFPIKEVGDFYNKNFINVKLDYEKVEADVFRKSYPVSAFPTLYYIDYDGDIVHVQKGAQDANGFVQIGKLALSKVDRTGDYIAEYEKGNRDPELVYNYVKALNQSGKSSLKVANNYLRTADLSIEKNLKILYISTTESDSRLFEKLVENRASLGKIYSDEEVDDKIEKACFTTVGKAVEFQLDMLHDEAIGKMKSHVPDRARKFATQADMLYYQGIGKVNNYVAACKVFAKKYVKKDAEKLGNLAKTMKSAFPLDQTVLKEAEKIQKKADKLNKA